MDKAALVSRYVLGLIFFVFGLNGFLGFITPPAPTAEGGAFLGALGATGYMFPFIKGVEVLAGLCFLSNRFVALALVVSAPITINIFLYHTILDPGVQQLFMPVVIVATSLIVAKSKADVYRPLLNASS
ncbi:MAG: acyltransferase [Bdellovibrionales bacterium]